MIASARISPGVFTYPVGSALPIIPPGALALPVTESEAFGDGRHPTTRLCAGAMDLLCRQRAPHAVLDVGTGTGILARIARARKASIVCATDIDPVALAAARANFDLDPLVPSAGAEVTLSSAAPDAWGRHFDLIVANILEEPLRRLAAALAGALRPEGRLLISGFTPIQIPALTTAFAAQSLEVRSQSSLEGWVLLELVQARSQENSRASPTERPSRG